MDDHANDEHKIGWNHKFETTCKCKNGNYVSKVPMPAPTDVFEEHECEKTDSSVAEAWTRTDICKGAMAIEKGQISSQTRLKKNSSQTEPKVYCGNVYTKPEKYCIKIPNLRIQELPCEQQRSVDCNQNEERAPKLEIANPGLILCGTNMHARHVK